MRRDVYQSFDLGEGLVTELFEVMRDLILAEYVSNQYSKTDTGQERGRGGGTSAGSWRRMVFQLVLDKLGEGSGWRGLGE